MAGVMHVAIVPIGMVMQSRHDDGAAGTATRRGCISVCEECSVCSNCIDVGCFDDGVAITTKIGAEVIGNDKHNVFLCCRQCRGEVEQKHWDQPTE